MKKKAPAFIFSDCTGAKVSNTATKVANSFKYTIMIKSIFNTIGRYFGFVAVLALALLFIGLGVYLLATATSNIHSFCMVGVAPLLLGSATLVCAWTLFDDAKNFY